MNLNEMSLEQLLELETRLASEIKTRRAAEQEKARQQILEIAQKAGISLDSLGKGSLRLAKSKGAKVAMQYRNPANPAEEWTGRGRQPKWVKDWVTSGQALSDLKIK